MTDTPQSEDQAGDRSGTQSGDRSKKSKGTKLWKQRPFSRVIKGWKAWRIARDYVKLNELEAQGKIPYQKNRLRGLSSGDWQLLRS